MSESTEQIGSAEGPVDSRAVVFVGPSLPHSLAEPVVGGAEVRGPAQRGDILRAVDDGFRTIVLVDGWYEHQLPPWHKEILFALEHQVRVIGASSMGAIRAAELAPFGMEPVGRIAQAMLAGELSDADVSLAHGPGPDFTPGSLPHADLHFTLGAAVEAGVIDRSDATAVSVASRSLFYAARTWPTVFDEVGRAGLDPARVAALGGFVDEHAVHQKRLDALEALEAAASGAPPARTSSFRLNRTIHFDSLIGEERSGNANRAGEATARLLDEVRSDPQLDARIRSGAAITSMASGWADAAGVRASQDLVDEASDAMRLALGLGDPDEFWQWLSAHAMDLDEWAELVIRQVPRHWAARHVGSAQTQHLVDELLLSGRAGEMRRRVERGDGLLFRSGYQVDGADTRRDPADDITAVAWFFGHVHDGDPPPDLERWASEQGFNGKDHLVRCCRRAWRIATLEAASNDAPQGDGDRSTPATAPSSRSGS